MTYAIRFLRAEIRRERAWLTSFRKDETEGVKIGASRVFEKQKRLKEERILSIQLVIQTLKKVKKSQGYERPQYYWLNPKVGQPKRLDIST